MRALANGMEPVVMIGKLGLTDAVTAAAEAEFLARELFKVRFASHKDEKEALASALAEACGAELVGITGNVALLFRKSPEAAGH
jgi:RNA-binding protein